MYTSYDTCYEGKQQASMQQKKSGGTLSKAVKKGQSEEVIFQPGNFLI